MNRLTVTADCPTCGAPLDFEEGANSVRCGHCRSNLLVTGRGRILTYFVEPHVEIHHAVAAAGLHEEREHRVGAARLRFIPYYRMTCQELAWLPITPEEKDIDAEVAAQALGFEIQSFASSWLGETFSGRSKDIIPLGQHLPDPASELKHQLQIKSRYVEKNFVAVDLHGLGVYSIGVRSATLRLYPFERTRVEKLGAVAAVQLSSQEALERGLLGTGEATYREVVGRVLSIVYFPLWFIDVERGGERDVTIVDGLSGAVTASVQAAVERRLDGSHDLQMETADFRPLVCPNCGWDLPVTPDDAIFFCSSCGRAWQIAGAEFVAVPHQMAEAEHEQSTWLPFWSLAGDAPTLVAAFRYRQLAALPRLTRALRSWYDAPAGELTGQWSVIGGYYDLEDAVRLARFNHTVIEARTIADLERMAAEEAHYSRAEVLWIPFAGGGNLLLESRGRQSLFRNLIF
jgi:LSD1 subclass zinc finger protein